LEYQLLYEIIRYYIGLYINLSLYFLLFLCIRFLEFTDKQIIINNNNNNNSNKERKKINQDFTIINNYNYNNNDNLTEDQYNFSSPLCNLNQKYLDDEDSNIDIFKNDDNNKYNNNNNNNNNNTNDDTILSRDDYEMMCNSTTNNSKSWSLFDGNIEINNNDLINSGYQSDFENMTSHITDFDI
jgi:hypothetical protein